MHPMFHFTPHRIETHMCICFVANKGYKELERRIKLAGINLNVDAVLDMVEAIITISINMPESG